MSTLNKPVKADPLVGYFLGAVLIGGGVYLIMQGKPIGWALVACALLFLPFVWNGVRNALPMRELGAIRGILALGLVVVGALPFIKGTILPSEHGTTRGGGAPPDLNDLIDAADPGKGRYHALIFAAEKYKEWPPLQYPIDDAQELKKVLTTDYQFNESDVQLFENPTRSTIISALNEFTKPGRLTENDNLLIVYAGHGKQHTITDEGFWVPIDGARDDPSNYVSAQDVLGKIQGLKARHVLLIVDACFSGTIFDLSAADRGDGDATKYYTNPSRKAMTSGALEEVSDNSLFMKMLLNELGNNNEHFLTATTLFHTTNDTLGGIKEFKQRPQFNAIHTSGNKGGDFVFVRKDR